jgi:hypothetical protein
LSEELRTTVHITYSRSCKFHERNLRSPSFKSVPYFGSDDLSPKNVTLLVFRGLWNDGTSASMYREIMMRNKSVFQISTLVCLSYISICNLLTDLPT